MTREVERLRWAAELSGLASPDTGDLGGRFPRTTPPIVPRVVELEGDDLVWSMLSDDETRKWPENLPDTQGALDRFLRIQDAQGVLRFARRFGPLCLCEHGVPFSHNLRCQPTKREPVSRWLELVKSARAVVMTASQMRQNRNASREDRDDLWAAWPQLQPGGAHHETFQRLMDMRRLGEELGVHSPAYSQWLLLWPVIDWWIDVARVRPIIEPGWQGATESPNIELQGYGILGVLGVQLLASVAGAHEIYFCQACGRVYERNRQPQRGRRHYCDRPECKAYGARLRKRDQRARESHRSESPGEGRTTRGS